MEFDAYDWNSIILGLLATCLFAECIILLVRVNSLKNSSLAEAEKIRTDEKLKYEKKGNELEMLYKEREIELKSEYEDLLSMAKAAKREQDEKLAELDARIRDAKFASERAEAEYARFSAVREDFRNSARQYAEKPRGARKPRCRAYARGGQARGPQKVHGGFVALQVGDSRKVEA